MKKKLTKKHKHGFKAGIIIFECKCGKRKIGDVPEDLKKVISLDESN